ncbi:MAG: hypothetical protein RL187_443 [Actinomycetota bacterium]
MRGFAQWIVRFRELALAGFVALIALSAVWGFQAFGQLQAGGYNDLGADSALVGDILEEEYDEDASELVLLVELPGDADSIDSSGFPTYFPLVQDLTDEVASIRGVNSVLNYYTLGSPDTLRSTDGTIIYVLVDFDEDASAGPLTETIVDQFSGAYQDATIYVAGYQAVMQGINHEIESDLLLAEAIVVPLVLILLVFVFGSLVSAGLPILVGGLAIVGSFFVMFVVSSFTDTSIFAINLITGLGLGLGIDYSLLIVNRFREERGQGRSVEQAVVSTLQTAGKTVIFSGLTVAVVMVSMAFFPQYFLQSFAVAGFSAVTLAVLGAIIALPAVLAILGDRVNALRIIRRDLTPTTGGGWERFARAIMRRPLIVILVTFLALGGATTLAYGVTFGQVDDRILPSDAPVAVASDLIRDRFDGRALDPVRILVQEGDTSLEDVAALVEGVEGITSVTTIPAAEGETYSRILALSDIEPRSPEGYEQILDIRALNPDVDEFLVGGSAAYYTDSQLGIENNLAFAAAWIVISTFILLFLFTGSILLPVKAIVLNVVSLGATLGIITYVFAEGHLQWLIGEFSVTGTIDTSSLVMIGVVAFGLSMDYELFLLSRIKEKHDQGLSTEDAIASGLDSSGRIITAAALVLAFTFSGFISSGVSIIKMLGLGIAVAILVDATIVRALMVPALMKIFGKANWWAPAPLARLHTKLGLSH